MRKKLSLYLQAGFYIFAGLNHFINPDFYYPLIPEYFYFMERINFMAGLFEVLFGIGLLIPFLRKASVFGIIMMLIAFIPSHIYFIQLGGCIEGGLCAPEWVGWVRLIVIHPILMYWAWSVRKVVVVKGIQRDEAF